MMKLTHAYRPPINAANYATLREIEGRLKSIRNIEKITKTMKIVASTKLTRAQRAMAESRSYGQASNEVFEKAETKPLEGEGKKTLLIICSSDKGLCGGIHSGMSRWTRRELQNRPDVDLAIVGEKCKSQLSRSHPQQIVLSFAGIGKDIPSFADASAIADQISLLPTEYASVQILYNKFINAQSYEPTPLNAFSEEAISASANFAAYEIDDAVLPNLREYALTNSIFWALAEGHACEQSARRNAMDVSIPFDDIKQRLMFIECIKERRRDDQEIPNLVQSYSTGCHHQRVGRDYYWCYCFSRAIEENVMYNILLLR